MGAMYPNRTFKVLIGAGVTLAVLLGVATYRTVLTGCPESHNMNILACLFLPTHTDLSIHLLSYVFIGTILLGVFSGSVLWCRQWTKMRLLT